jgi:hypothetical protein
MSIGKSHMTVSASDKEKFVNGMNCAVRAISRLLFVCLAMLGAAGCAKAQAPPQQAQGTPQRRSLQVEADWRARMQANHNADSSIAQQVRRLTRDLELTPSQQVKVQQFAKVHNERIQNILDTAPDTLSYAAFQVQVHAISQDFHNSVNAILTPHQLDLMKAMVGRLGNGRERRRAP